MAIWNRFRVLLKRPVHPSQAVQAILLQVGICRGPRSAEYHGYVPKFLRKPSLYGTMFCHWSPRAAFAAQCRD